MYTECKFAPRSSVLWSKRLLRHRRAVWNDTGDRIFEHTGGDVGYRMAAAVNTHVPTYCAYDKTVLMVAWE